MHHFSAVAAGVGAAPIPGADMPLLWGLQSKMLRDVAEHFGHHMSVKDSAASAALLGGGGFIARALARQGVKFVPIIGWLVSGAVAAAGTEAFGKAAIAYCRNKFGCEDELRQIQLPAL